MAGSVAWYSALWSHGVLGLIGVAEVDCTLLLISEQISCDCCFVLFYRLNAIIEAHIM